MNGLSIEYDNIPMVQKRKHVAYMITHCKCVHDPEPIPIRCDSKMNELFYVGGGGLIEDLSRVDP